MYICPNCKLEFQTEKEMKQHFMLCWLELHPYQQSAAAPHSEDKMERTNDIVMENFLARFKNARSSN